MEKMPKWADVVLIPLISLLLATILSAIVILAIGEDPLEAAKRELFEETGIAKVSLIGECREWLNYELPDELLGIALKGKYRGQTQKWYAFRFEGNENEINISHPLDGAKPEFDHWEWKDLSAMPDLIVPFKRNIYERLVVEFDNLA